MEKSLFEQMDGTYTQQGDYFLPDLTLLPQEEQPVGVWAERLTVTESLKADNTMAWVGKMNSTHNIAQEVINNEIIYV